MADLNLFLNKDMTADDVTHSNGMGAVAGGAGAGGLSIEKRRQLMNQPRVIGSYVHSARLAHLGSSLKARTATQQTARIYDANNDSFSDEKLSNRQQGGIKDRKQIESSVDRRQQFIEPKARNFDKFA